MCCMHFGSNSHRPYFEQTYLLVALALLTFD
nr:MAG TPA: hypothetical protein [Caudoviricetes sp.]